MNVLLWILFGAVSGWVASIIMKTNSQQGLFMDVLLGVVGAVVGGFVMNLFGQSGVTGFDFYSLAVAIFGAITVIWFSRMVRNA